jgi:glycosyltransferase involved in cell wall biosynthesis
MPPVHMTERLRVIFITEWYPTKESPVGCNYIREHAKAVSLYDDVVLLHMAGHDQRLRNWWEMKREKDESLSEGIETYRILYRRSSIPKISYFICIWSVIRAFKRIVERGFRPDIIHAHVYEAAVPAVIIGKLYRIPVVVSEHSSEFPRKRLSRLKIFKAKASFRFAEAVMPVSAFLMSSIKSHGISGRFLLVPNVVDTRLFYPARYKKSGDGVARLLAVSLLDETHNKGFPVLFKGLAELRLQREDWHLEVVGDGPARRGYEKMVQELGIVGKVSFCGMKTKGEVAEHMRNSDIFILPSLVETFSVVCAEAMVSGVPVLVTRCGGPEGFVDERMGVMVPTGDSQALCNGLNFMLDNLVHFSSEYISEQSAAMFAPHQVGRRLHKIYGASVRKTHSF